MFSRRRLLQSTAGSTALGLGVLSGTDSAAAATPVTELGNGVNLQAGYTSNTTTGQEPPIGWGLMADQAAIETVRIEIEPPTEGKSKFGIEGYKNLISEATAAGLDVIASYHHAPYNGSNDKGTDRESLRAAGDWWANNYPALREAGEFTVNFINEWGSHGVDPHDTGRWYKTEIAKLRDAGYDGQVIVDCTGYAQDIHNTVEGLEAWLSWEEIAIGVHVYGKASPATSARPLRESDLDEIAGSSFPGIIGEFGTRLNYDDSPNADVESVVKYARDELDWPVLAWAWNGDGEDWPMNMTLPQWASDEVSYSVPEDQTYELNLECNGGDGYFNEMHSLLGGTEQTCDGGGGSVSPPTSLDVGAIGENRLAVSWDRNGGTEYQIYYENQSTKNGYSEYVTDASSVELTGLASGTEYEISVGAVTDDGGRAWSYNSVFASTDSPVAAPTDLRVDATTNERITVVWDRNGGTDYQVYYENQTTNNGYSEYVTDDNWAELNGLDSGTQYEISVGVVTAGDGRDWSADSIVASTDRPVAAPTDLRVDSTSEDRITVVWDRNGGTDYQIYYVNQRTGTGYSEYVTDDNWAELNDLDPGTEYEISVGAVTSDDGRAWSHDSLIASTERVVSRPTNLRFDYVSDSQLTVVWDRHGGTDYEVYYENLRTGTGYSEYVTDDNWAELTGLDAGTQYRVWLGAITDGDGREWSRSTTQSTDW